MSNTLDIILSAGLPTREANRSLGQPVQNDGVTKQLEHDNLNANANLQVGNSDVSDGNPAPVTTGTRTTRVGGLDGTSTQRTLRTDSAGRPEVVGAVATGTTATGVNPVLVGGVNDGNVYNAAANASGQLQVEVWPQAKTVARNTSAFIAVGGTSVHTGNTHLVRVILSYANLSTVAHVFFTDDASAGTSTTECFMQLPLYGSGAQSIECGFDLTNGINVFHSVNDNGASPTQLDDIGITVVTQSDGSVVA